MADVAGNFGGGGGNRTRVRMASNQRVYVRSLRSVSARIVSETGVSEPSSVWFSPPATTKRRSGGQPSDDARNPLEGVADGRRYPSFR